MDDEENDPDTKVIPMRKGSILDLINNPTGLPGSPPREAAIPAATPPPVKPAPPPAAPSPADPGSDPLPLPGDAYQAHSRTANKPQVMLCLVQQPPAVTILAYSDLRFIDLLPPEKPGGNPVLLMKFIGVAEVRLEGWHLDSLADLLRRHCLAWVREHPSARGFPGKGDNGSIVVNLIRVKPIE